ncbi:hypothetical protein SAMN04488104_1006103 [Algoriphagus faecimaris]|uniref:Cellobiose phosphorylase n=1 Tax=Algoriphagus faecimaris TaxID=686796 RepID=A0A1G6PNK1_9BACT|nr:hypothetical protein [Algoriphagus faecimaris]SDC80925.1 hypothetical protein SAMN04488104_1006103 [Algoriphagus faecimaris]
MKKSESTQLKQVEINKEVYYQISNVDSIPPFFISLISPFNHWIFIGSNGGLTAGRKDPENALFPYYTDDKIIESSEVTGSKTIFRVQKDGQTFVWEPFSIHFATQYRLRRNFYKNVLGNKILFEEENLDLNLSFQYQWASSDVYGFVKTSKITNLSKSNRNISCIDGIQNIMPHGVGSALQGIRSNLVDAYKRNELESESGIGIFALSAIIVDKAEPSEALKASIAWSVGLENGKRLLSSSQLDAFRSGQSIKEETDIKAQRGAYFVVKDFELSADESKEWMIVADINQNVSQIMALAKAIKNDSELISKVKADIRRGSQELIKLNAASDGLQLTADKLKDTRHFANTMFNIMRGGIFDNNYLIEKSDLKNNLLNANRELFALHKSSVEALPDVFPISQLKELANKSSDQDFKRLCLEYLPLKFSRRHGDPSRPWNNFSINTRNESDGSKVLDYAGNWRDIFQNWEALALSYPEFIEGMILKFLNASTFDGYNPYRITKNGIDWERIEEDDPWSYIGYWGDHQIIYLLKFLEFAENYAPGRLSQYFSEDIFVYANVPYKIKPYEDILSNPKDTIDFDHELDHAIQKRWTTIGSDAALLQNRKGTIHHVNFIEKILCSVLAKISNFIPEGGIWMNTQRPEWNDANNALVGNGVSMVTLYYLRRFLSFFGTILGKSAKGDVQVSAELLEFFKGTFKALTESQHLLSGKISNRDRKRVLDNLGIAGSKYRSKIYKESFSSQRKALSIQEVIDFCSLCQNYLEHTIQANKREDNLYHAYNLMTLENEEEVSISYLSEMLEGQVAALSSGYLSSEEALSTLDSLRKSKLYREDQNSYLLYPNKELPGFLEKNNISSSDVAKSGLLKQLLENGNKTIIEQDVNGDYHFNGSFKNAADLALSLEKLEQEEYSLTQSDKKEVLDIFEKVFNHKAFTGRSGTFYGYEGLGSIYWHMVSKLQLASLECCIKASKENGTDETLAMLISHYYEINEGIGVHKSPTAYGAFPTDPYSHTPAGKGAQQPGMTGQVKEDIISRFGELGVFIYQGKLIFDPFMLKRSEFLTKSQIFEYVDVQGESIKIPIGENALCFTFCQVPMIYELGTENSIEIFLEKGIKKLQEDTLELNKDLSQKIFNRTGEIKKLVVRLKKSDLK